MVKPPTERARIAQATVRVAGAGALRRRVGDGRGGGGHEGSFADGQRGGWHRAQLSLAQADRRPGYSCIAKEEARSATVGSPRPPREEAPCSPAATGSGTSPRSTRRPTTRRSTGSSSRTSSPGTCTRRMSFALFRTYAVPSIGRLLDETGEFRRAPQKRYDDTVLLLDEPARAGLHSESGLRRHPADQPDARRLRHLRRRPALRAVHVRRGAAAVARRLRLAPAVAGGGAGERLLLPRPRPADGDQGPAGDLRGVRGPADVVRGGALRLRRGRPPGRRRDAAPAARRSTRRSSPRPGARRQPGAAGRPAARGLRLPAALRRPCAGWSAPALRARGRVVAVLPARRRPRHSPDMPTDQVLPGRVRRRRPRHLPARLPAVARPRDRPTRLSRG